MTWLAALVFRRYQDRRTRQHTAQALAAPPALHPSLGLGGRSIELSLASNISPDPGAFLLAADDFHAHALRHGRDRDELLQAGQWLWSLWPSTDRATALAQLDDDLDRLSRQGLEGTSARQGRLPILYRAADIYHCRFTVRRGDVRQPARAYFDEGYEP